jgi:hypothetical protein
MIAGQEKKRRFNRWRIADLVPCAEFPAQGTRSCFPMAAGYNPPELSLKEANMPFGSLALPGVVSAVAVWLLSAVVHMALRYHRADYKQLSNEEGVAQAVRQGSPSPGVYFIPYCIDPAQMKDPAMRKKFEDGPVAMLTVLKNGPPALGKHLVQWFLFCVLVSFVTAYVARHTLATGAAGREILRLTATMAFVGYGFGSFQDSIWKAIPWSNSLRGLLDAVLYALATGFVFLWLWPHA